MSSDNAATRTNAPRKAGPDDDPPVANRVTIITGASSGIGRAAAVAFTRRGDFVVLGDLDTHGGAETVRLCGGPEVAEFVRTDTSVEPDVEQLVGTALERFGRLDYAFNNAGIDSAGQPTADVSLEEWNRVISINLTGVWLCVKHEIRAMSRTGGGSIANTSSALGLVGIANQPAYVAAKHGVIGLTRAAALEYSAKGIRVNAVLPGVVRTPLFERAVAADPGVLQAIESMHPIGRLGQASEIADAAVWLCSDASSFVTGHALSVDGGYGAQ